MIRIVFQSGPEGRIQEFMVKGHAGYDEAGKDIVCAAVSAVAQTAVIGLMTAVGIHPEHRQQNGLLHCILPDEMSDEQIRAADIILKTMLAGLRSIRDGYPDLISIEERTVE
jgi:uncharacterized protein YsxB (DUF464 family)